MNDAARSHLRLARDQLSALLPPSWRLRADARALVRYPALRAFSDEVWTLTGPGVEGVVLAVTRRGTLTNENLRDLAAVAQNLPPTPVSDALGSPPPTLIVSAPWLSANTRKQLEGAGLSYVDATGNLNIRVEGLPVLLQTVGASHNPSARRVGKAGIRGDQALGVVRYLVDHSPPLSQSEIATATGSSLGYVSKILRTLEEGRLVVRDGGTVTDVDWPSLLRERAAQAPPLLSETSYVPMIARRGLDVTLKDLPSALQSTEDVWVTGSAAAQLIAPLAPTTQLTIRVRDPASVRRRLGLLHTPADSKRADVLLISTNFDTASAGARQWGPLPIVAPSQLVIDCLTGTGRMPAEGEAVLEWMISNPVAWRRPGPGQRARNQPPTRYTRTQTKKPTEPPSGPIEAVETAEGWSRAVVASLVARLDSEHPAQARAMRVAANSDDAVISRDQLYEVAGYPETRSLRGFTRPISRLTSTYVQSGALGADTEPALAPIYDESNRASGFRLSPTVAKFIREIDMGDDPLASSRRGDE